MVLTVTEPKEKHILLRTYASNIHKSSLKEFAQKQGYGNDYIVLWFKEDLEEAPYEFQEELSKIKDNQVLLSAIPPAAPEEENLYLDFDEFYGYLLTEVLRRIKESPEDKDEYLELLREVKKALKL